MLNNELDVHVSHNGLVQLSLHQFIVKAEDIVSSEFLIDLILEAFPRTSQLPAEILVLLRLLSPGSLDEPVLVA
jgi:hypothetical protein